jgi:hypothetical protein
MGSRRQRKPCAFGRGLRQTAHIKECIIKPGVSGPDLGQNSLPGLLKRLNSPYRPALSRRGRATVSRALWTGLLGRSQAVRQWILIPPFGGSIPPAPASHSGIRPGSPRSARMGRKRGLFACSISSPESQIGNRRAPIGESLRPNPRIFPFCRDCRRRRGSIKTAARTSQSNCCSLQSGAARIGSGSSFTGARAMPKWGARTRGTAERTAGSCFAR